jgi:hypothetical protein
MAEDAGKKKFIRDFLQRIRVGEGFIEDIWIERDIRLPGSEGKGSTAKSLSGNSVNNITELLQDDIRHSFENGYFTFRIVSAMRGNGKTSLLTYLHELIKTQTISQSTFVVSRFPLTNLVTMGGSQDFSVKLYCYVLAETFWQLLNSSEMIVKDTARYILNAYLDKDDVNQLVASSRLDMFRHKFIKNFSTIAIVFEEFFFDVIREINKVKSQYVFAYLIDEFDGLEKNPNERQLTSSMIRGLIKRSAQEFGSKIRLFIYLVGTSENIKTFLDEDPIIESLVSEQVINLNTAYDLNTGCNKEFETVRGKIDDRIKGAFSGYKDFDKAWNEISNIQLKQIQTFRKFCQEYTSAILAIYEKYFKEEPEKKFEGNAREIIEGQCHLQWKSFLNQKSYKLSSGSTTTIIEGHAFDCYIGLLHNGALVAQCYGEAKNYELLSSHLTKFKQWLKDANFRPSSVDKTPADLAFMIAPSCSPLLQRKLKLEHIQFIQSDKVVHKNIDSNKEQGDVGDQKSSIDINIASMDQLKLAFQGTKYSSENTFKRLMKGRPYKDLNDLDSKMKLSDTAKKKLQAKIDGGEICFGSQSALI